VVKVHIHADDPGVVLSYAAALGSLDQIKVDNMQAQTRTLGQQREQSRAREERTPANGRPPVESVDGTLSVLAVAAGEGIADALRSLGASGIVAGGQTMNPSIEELLSAVEADGNDDVILLPNNPNIVLTANQVPALTGKQVAVVPSRSIPQGLAALATFNVDASLAANVERMTAALETVRTIELTRAVRDAEIDGVRVAKGQIIGLLDDRLVAAGEDPNAVACQTLEEAGLDSAELVTVFTGEGARPEQATDLREAILALAPEVTVEIVDGGQPHYRFVIAVE
jgi:dihydroxyacetone kinase-like predicted kinase